MKPTLVLLAAGMSTRYGRLKQLEPVGPGGEALLDYAVFDAGRAGFSRVLLIVREELEGTFRQHIQGRWPGELDVVFHHQKIRDLPGVGAPFLDSPTFLAALESRKKPWGTAHALLTARPHLPGPFVLLNADDFYGDSGFGRATEFLKTSAPLPTFGLVTYTLGDTLSEHGGVSRGVCQVDDGGWLEGIREVLEIRRGEAGLEGRTVSGREVALTGQEPISTNFWVFTPEVFPLLEAGFLEFIEAQAEPATAPPEFLIPTVVNEAIQGRRARVKAIPTADRFLGITHPPDREWVVKGLAEMSRAGRYPSPLWA